MKNLFEPTVANNIIARFEKINSGTQPQWGKMDAAQMMAHCQAAFQVYFGEKKLKRGFIGFLFGKIAKRKLFDNKPWPQNLPTAKEFVFTSQKDLETEKISLINSIKRFSSGGDTGISTMHPFFGKMTSKEWSLLFYKHLDHHLQQFGV